MSEHVRVKISNILKNVKNQRKREFCKVSCLMFPLFVFSHVFILTEMQAKLLNCHSLEFEVINRLFFSKTISVSYYSYHKLLVFAEPAK